MTWPIVALISTALLLLVTTYAVWCLNGLEQAKGKRDALRIEAESALAKTVGTTLESHAAEMKSLRLKVENLQAARVR